MRDVSTSQTNFESAPVVVRADVAAAGYAGEPIVAAVIDEAGKVVERQEAKSTGDGKPLSFRFQFRPERKGRQLLPRPRLPGRGGRQDRGRTRSRRPRSEQTLANNSRLVVVDQGGGPYRVLYVSGRPNWEFKFLRRAVADDEQVQLVGLLRIARRQPKFDFQSSARNRTISPLFDGFDHPDPDTAERADQSVLVRLGTLDEVELRDGFPKTAEDLYRYHAIVIDDLEAAFFTQDQLGLLRNFVSTRGGGLLMLGGPDSFADGKYDRTPVGELLPVYLNGPAAAPGTGARRATNWCSPARAGSSRGCGRGRPRTRNGSGWPRCPPSRPSAGWAASSRGPSRWPRSATTRGTPSPRSSPRQFGKGHVAALLIGDLWRWGMRRDNADGERPRAVLAPDRPLARQRRPQPGGGLRPPQGRRPRRRPSSSRSACATPSSARSITRRSPSRSPCPMERQSRSMPSPTAARPACTRPPT